MKVTISAEQLSAALETAARVAPKKSTLPILETVLLDATPDGGLLLAGTDLRTRAWRTVPALVEEAGTVCLPPARIASFLEAIPDDAEIRLTVDAARKAVLSAGKTTSRIAGLNAEEFPAGPDFDAPALDLTLAADILAGCINRTAHAAAKDDSRPALAGLNLAFDGSSIAVTAADGYRLAHAESELPEGSDEVSLIVPARPLTEVARALKNATSARLKVDGRGSSLLIDSEAGCWSLALIGGTFPDFRRVVPRDTPIAVTTSRSALLRALRLVKGLEATSDGFKVHLVIGADQIEIMASDRQADHEARTTIDAEMVRGEGLQISFNTTYLSEAVEAIEGDGVLLELTSATSPCLLRSVRGPETDWCVVMPMMSARPGA